MIVKIMEQVALIPSHLLALYLQRKYARVARIKDTTVLYPRRENTRRAGRRISVGCTMMRIAKEPFARSAENTRRAGRRISVGCTMMRIAKEPFARSASNLEFLVFSVLEGCGSQNPSKIGRKLLKK